MDDLPESMIKEFKTWLKQILLLIGCRILERLFIDSLNDCGVHVFNDVSKISYAACVFLWITN